MPNLDVVNHLWVYFAFFVVGTTFGAVVMALVISGKRADD